MQRTLSYSPLWARAITFVLVLSALWIGAAAQAHENTPSIVNMEIGEDGNAVLSIRVNAESLLAGSAGAHDNSLVEASADEYEALRATSAAELKAQFEAFVPEYIKGLNLTLDGEALPLTFQDVDVPEVGDVAVARASFVAVTAPMPNASGVLTWSQSADFGDSVLRVFVGGGEEPKLAEFTAQGDTLTLDLSQIEVPKPTWQVFLNYIKVGFDHIIPKGLDHILFVIGLFLLSTQMRPLIMQVTMFTLAHTITLALGALGYVNVPGHIVEPLIAASIAFVAIENLFTQKLSPWRPALIFGFGLLHGLGFASVLGDFGLPTGQFIPALIAFNIGVEVGQLAVILACFLAVGIWFRNKSWYHKGIVVPASLMIAAIAIYWVLERTGMI